jgi:hypothetical protein
MKKWYEQMNETEKETLWRHAREHGKKMRQHHLAE